MFGDKYRTIAPRFMGYAQQDSQALSFLLDGLHKDLNRIIDKSITQTVDQMVEQIKLLL